jgi:hypothetical protein
MDKEQVSFTISKKMREVLGRLAEAKGISFEDVLQDAVEDYIYGNAIKSHWGDDQRRFNRNRTNIPVVVQIGHGEGEALYSTGTIIDISMGGVRISIPSDERPAREVLDSKPDMQVRFRVPGEQSSLKFSCKPARINEQDDDLQVGVTFSDADFGSLQLLHRYVM